MEPWVVHAEWNAKGELQGHFWRGGMSWAYLSPCHQALPGWEKRLTFILNNDGDKGCGCYTDICKILSQFVAPSQI